MKEKPKQNKMTASKQYEEDNQAIFYVMFVATDQRNMVTLPIAFCSGCAASLKYCASSQNILVLVLCAFRVQ
jgi:hypothetical protein